MHTASPCVAVTCGLRRIQLINCRDWAGVVTSTAGAAKQLVRSCEFTADIQVHGEDRLVVQDARECVQEDMPDGGTSE